ncbi:basigin-like [Uloborus diversus]|uniref:basigin-like n=1 Tax=Uloborus diversus TaxID=327109 RepID=UPI0024098B32|nr:basigin-like [Uloborus diversus]
MEELLFIKQLVPSIICGLLCFISAVSSLNSTSNSTTYVQKGGKFILACEVAGLDLHLWYKDGKPVVPNNINKFHLETDSPTYSPSEGKYYTTMRLIVNSADAVHTGKYKCNSDGLHPQNVIVITENMIKTNEDEPGMGIVFIPGQPLVLQCNTSECPQCTVQWFKEGAPLNFTERITRHAKNNSIIIKDTTYDDGGTYMCAIDRKQLDIALNATIVVQSKIKLDRFDQSAVVVQGSALELYCVAKGAPTPYIKWFIGEEEIKEDDERVKLLDFEGLKNAKLVIEEADFSDRNHYTCEAFNQFDSCNTTVFIRIKDKLAALWPFLGICAEVAILCTIIFVYERNKSRTQLDEPETDLPTENKHHRDQKAKGQDIRQRK